MSKDKTWFLPPVFSSKIQAAREMKAWLIPANEIAKLKGIVPYESCNDCNEQNFYFSHAGKLLFNFPANIYENNNLLFFTHKQKTGIATKEGKIILKPDYQIVKQIKNNIYWIENEKGKGLIKIL